MSAPRGPSGRARRGVSASAVADWGRFAYHAPRPVSRQCPGGHVCRPVAPRVGPQARPPSRAGRAPVQSGGRGHHSRAKPEQGASPQAGSSVKTCGHVGADNRIRTPSAFATLGPSAGRTGRPVGLPFRGGPRRRDAAGAALASLLASTDARQASVLPSSSTSSSSSSSLNCSRFANPHQ